jgi:hypothetical protein
VIGFLSGLSSTDYNLVAPAFLEGLNETGFVDGRNITIEYHWAEGDYGRLATLSADLVQRQVTVIAAISGTPKALAAKAATTTIPIVFAIGGDPIPGLVFLFWGDIFSLFAATVGDAFGRKFVTVNYGIMCTAKGVAALLVPLGNVLTHFTGSWHAVYAIGCGMNAVAALLGLFVLRPLINSRLRAPQAVEAQEEAARNGRLAA